MFFDFLLNKAEKLANPIIIDESKCSRFRNSDNECNDCLKACRFDAISIDEKIQINKNCTNCMACFAECKNEALSIEFNISKFEQKHKKSKNIVIGCFKSSNHHDIKKNCIGWLSKEFLLYFSTLFENVIVDYSKCYECKNSCIMDRLKYEVANNYSNITFVQDTSIYKNNDETINRRDFFKQLKTGTKKELTEYMEKDNYEEIYYGEKKIPLKRNLLISLKNKGRLSNNNLIYDIEISDSCDYCLECVAICPNNVFIENEDEKFDINTINCTACNLCTEFCDKNSINIKSSLVKKGEK